MVRSSTLVILNCADLQQLRSKPWSFGETPLALFYLLDEDQTLHLSIWLTLRFAPELMASDCSRWCMVTSSQYVLGEQLIPRKLWLDVAVTVFAWNRPCRRLWRKTMIKTTATQGGPAHPMPPTLTLQLLLQKAPPRWAATQLPHCFRQADLKISSSVISGPLYGVQSRPEWRSAWTCPSYQRAC